VSSHVKNEDVHVSLKMREDARTLTHKRHFSSLPRIPTLKNPNTGCSFNEGSASFRAPRSGGGTVCRVCGTRAVGLPDILEEVSCHDIAFPKVFEVECVSRRPRRHVEPSEPSLSPLPRTSESDGNCER